MTAPDVRVLAITMKRNVDRRDRALWAGEVLIMAASPEEIVDVAKRPVGE
jgi:hypothetical protein